MQRNSLDTGSHSRAWHLLSATTVGSIDAQGPTEFAKAMSKLAKESRWQIPGMLPSEKMHFWSSWGHKEVEVLAFTLDVEN